MPCSAEMLTDVELFEHLHDEDRRRLAELIDVRTLEAGATLFHAGEPGESLFVVHKGEVELFIRDTAGQKIVLTVAGQGEIFGELALLDRGARTATAVALSDTELLELDRQDLLLLFETTPAAALRLLAAMGRMTRKADELLKTRVSRNVNEEVQEQLSPLQRAADWIALVQRQHALPAHQLHLVRDLDLHQHPAAGHPRPHLRGHAGTLRAGGEAAGRRTGSKMIE